MPDRTLSFESQIADTARKGFRGGVPFDQVMMSDDSVEAWQNFRPGYVSPTSSQKELSKSKVTGSLEDLSGDVSINDRESNPLMSYLIKP